nr:RnfABCDGE type electron transport complex subunit D [Pseudoalteromonas sp. WY3]
MSAATTNKGRLIYGAAIGLLVYLIRTFGGFPDAVALVYYCSILLFP